MKTKYKTRDEVLKNKLLDLLKNDTSTVTNIMKSVKEYEEANLLTIEKLNRVKRLDVKKISGALKQCIQAHGPISENHIPSAAKRIFGSVMLEDNCADLSKNTENPFSIRGIILGATIASIIYLIINLIAG